MSAMPRCSPNTHRNQENLSPNQPTPVMMIDWPSLTLRIDSRGIGVDGSGPGACIDLGGPRQCLRVDILPDVRQFAISNGNVEDPVVIKRPIRRFDFPSSEADDQNPVSLRYELGGLWV